MKLLSKVHPLVWFGLISAIILAGGIYFIGQTNKPETSSKDLLGEVQADAGREHIPEGSPLPQYTSDPPTSGPHYPQWAQVGIYDTELSDGSLIHNLEHGHVWISYKPDLPADSIAKIKQIVGDKPRMVIVTPRSKNDSPIALASWQHLLKLENVDEKVIKDFIKKNRGNGPEFVP